MRGQKPFVMRSFEGAVKWCGERGKRVEILTVDNHCDGAYTYLRMKKENHPRAQQVLDARGAGAVGPRIATVGHVVGAAEDAPRGRGAGPVDGPLRWL